MNIQPADRLRLLGAMLQLQNNRLMQNVAFHLDLGHRRGHRCPRQCWVRKWILERPLFGQYEVLMDQLLNFDLYGCSNFVRLSSDLFRVLVERVGPVIQKEKTRFCQPLPSGLNIAITLRYLATGDSNKTLVWFQGGFQHIIPVCATGVCGHLLDLQGRTAVVLKYPRRMARKCSLL